MRLPRYIRDRISSRATMLSLLNPLTHAEARKQAIAEIAEETGYRSKPSIRLPKGKQNKRPVSAQVRRDAAHFTKLMLTDLPQRIVEHFKPSLPSTSLEHRRTPARPDVRLTRQDAPSPVEPPQHHFPLLHVSSGGVRSGAININHEFSDSPATQTWRQQNQRE